MSKKWILSIIILVLLPSSGWALPTPPIIPSYPSVSGTGSTYYVNKDTGNNGNTGADGDEWATIAYGISRMSAGDTLIVEEAVTAYSESLSLTNMNGSSNQWYQIKGKSGERPDISGGFDVGAGTASSYIYIGNFDITASGYAGIRTRESTTHVVFDDLDVGNTGTFAVVIGEIYETGSSDIYLRDVVAHGSTSTVIQLYARSHDIVMERVTAYGSTGVDGIGSHLAWGAGETWPNIGPPDDNANTISDVYLVDCLVYNNDDEGIDLANIRGETVIKNTKIYNNGNTGVKVWGLEVWLINNLIYENDTDGIGAGGITIKPLWVSSPYYLIGNTLVSNGINSKGKELRVGYINGSYSLKTPLLYTYNNLYMTNASGTANIILDGPNCLHQTCFIEGDGNLYFKPSDNTYGLIEYDGDWNIDHSFDIDEMSDGTWNTASGIDANAVSSISGSDPRFTNLAGDDYTLTDTSIAVDAGADIGITEDIQGTARPQGNGPDIGAYEHASESPELPEAPIAPKGLKVLP